MDERVIQFRVGVMVLATLIIAAILIVMLGEFPTPFRRAYTIEVIFPEAPGVKEGTPVRKSGIRVGRVTRVGFAADDPRFADQRGVIVTAEIDSDKKLYEDEVCQIRSSLLGDVELDFVIKDYNKKIEKKKAPSRELLDTGRVLEGKSTADPTGLKDVFQDEFKTVKDAGRALAGAGDALKTAAERAGKLLEEDGLITNVASEARTTLVQVRKVAESANKIIGEKDTQEKLRNSLAALPDKIDNTFKRLNTTMNLVDESLRSINEFTGPLGKNGAERVRKIDRAISTLDSLMTQMETFSRRLNSQQGSLGKLVHDPELYNHLNSAARKIDKLTRKLEPIINDMRVFTDKIARDPGSLGVRGALKRNIPIK